MRSFCCALWTHFCVECGTVCGLVCRGNGSTEYILALAVLLSLKACNIVLYTAAPGACIGL